VGLAGVEVVVLPVGSSVPEAGLNPKGIPFWWKWSAANSSRVRRVVAVEKDWFVG